MESDVRTIFGKDGDVYDGNVLVSLQSKHNNSSINVELRRPRLRVSAVGVEFISNNSKACVSSLDIADTEVLEFDDYKSYHIEYDKSGIMISVVFTAA